MYLDVHVIMLLSPALTPKASGSFKSGLILIANTWMMDIPFFLYAFLGFSVKENPVVLSQ